MSLLIDPQCPECNKELEEDDLHYMVMHGCCKCCYDDFHFGEEDADEMPG